ncbi:MAG: alpha/beta fold hydrolase [Phycisphaerales bacterium JB040]
MPRPLAPSRCLILVSVALAALGVAGCSSPLSKLPSERTVEPTASLIAAHDQIENHTELYTTSREGEQDVRVAIHRLGPGDSTTKLVFLHGVFADSESWRYVAGQLATDHDLWLVDSPGCGDSDVPHPSTLRPDGYSPGAMADRILQALAGKLRDEPAGTRLVLVAHSLGGAVAIHMLADPELEEAHAGTVGRIDRAVLLAPLDFAQHKADADIRTLATIDGLALSAGAATGYIQRQCRLMTEQGFADQRYAVREEAEKRFEILSDPARRRALQAQLLQAVAFDEDFLPQWEQIDRQTELYRRVRVPTLIVWGAWDEVLPVAKGYMFRALMPDSELVVVPALKHSAHLERPVWTAGAIESFLDGRVVAAPPARETQSLVTGDAEP